MTAVHDTSLNDSTLTEDPRQRLELMRTYASTMFIVGAVTCASGALITAATHEARMVQLIVGGGFLFGGAVVLTARPRRRLFDAAVIFSVFNVGLLISGSNPLGMAAMGYLWPISFTAYFLSRRTLVAVCVVSEITLAVGLAVNHHHHLKLDTLVGTSASIGIVAGLLASMNRREERLRTELELTAGTDPLTGLLNRRGFAPQLSAMIQRSDGGRNGPLAFVMFDLDHFKQFNDRHGHLIGDQALHLLADVLRRQCSSRDSAARLGGEEFAVAMPGASPTHALAYATRVAAALRRECAPGWDLRVCAGIAQVTDTDDTTTLLDRADEALYAAKRAGRNRAAWWEHGIEVGPPFSDE